MSTERPQNHLIKTGLLQGVKGKLILSYSFFGITVIMSLIAFWWFINQEKELQSTTNTLTNIARKVQTASNIEKDFFIVETINTQFYESGKSKYIDKHHDLLSEVRGELITIKENSDLIQKKDILKIDSAIYNITKFEGVFDSLVREILTRGFRSYGSIGNMRRAISRVYNSGYEVDKALILSVRRHEKDYLLRKDKTYIMKLNWAIKELKESVDQTLTENYGKELINSSLQDYKNSFNEIVVSDSIIGFRGQIGLRDRLNTLLDAIENNIFEVENRVVQSAKITRNSVQSSLIFLFILLIALTLILSTFLASRITKPLRFLSSSIHSVVKNNFDDSTQLYQPNTHDEIKQLALDVDYMLVNVKDRTKEVIQQKEQISESYENVKKLQEMGQDISSELSIEKISQKLYLHICSFFPSNLFFIGIKDEANKQLEFRGGVLNGKPIGTFTIPFSENKKLATWVLNTQNEIVSGDFSSDLTNKYIGLERSVIGEEYNSVIYLPLVSQNKTIGVLSLQAVTPHLYGEYQASIIKNLALFATSAIENASMYEILEEKVKERTQEVLHQKEEIESQKEKLEKSFNNVKLLSKIGQLITSHLSTDKISDEVYKSINNLMDAPIFGIGVLNEASDKIIFNNTIENYTVLSPFSYNIKDDESYSVWCFKNKKEIVINDVQKDYKKYIKSLGHLETDKGTPNSIVYMPIWAKRNVLGVISVQSFKKNAYSEYHLDILRNLSIYLGIALENASTYHQIEKQKDQIQETNKKITHSINYASRIQNAILPSIEKIRKELPESFIFYKPRDIVSGDFYWFAKKGNKLIIAAVDCTGHGVPGAFMSVIGNNLLQKLVIERDIVDPGKLLTEMHAQLFKLLSQGDKTVRDGMDISVCVINKANHSVEFSGANNPMLFIQNDVYGTPQLYRIKGEKFPVGGMKKEGKEDRKFKTHTIKTSEPLELWANEGSDDKFENPPIVTKSDTTVYLFSDGFQDQFGGKEGKKFMAKRFRSLLYDIHHKPMNVQKELLEKNLEIWINSYESEIKQLDDILVIGFKI